MRLEWTWAKASGDDEARYICEVLRKRTQVVNDCAVWMGAHNGQGYGFVQFAGERWLTHRVSYFLEHGTIERGLQCQHTCDVPGCVNPAHLKLGTPKDNSADAIERVRLNGPRRPYRPRQKGPDGRAPGRLPFDKVRAAKDLAAHGRSVPDIAVALGISVTEARNIVTGKSYRSVGAEIPVVPSYAKNAMSSACGFDVTMRTANEEAFRAACDAMRRQHTGEQVIDGCRALVWQHEAMTVRIVAPEAA